MSEFGKKASRAAEAVENTLAAVVKDMESGLGTFFSGGNAITHEPEPLREARQERDSTGGQIIANQQIDGKDYYLVQTENPAGQSERVLFEKNGTNYQPGQDVVVKWDEGKPAHAKADKGVELPWGGNFTGQSQFTSNDHDQGQGL